MDVEVEVVWGHAEGRTPLGAFDGALAAAGVGEYNLVGLSSVLPAGASVTERGTHERTHPVGTPVGAVIASQTATERGTVAAGLGWQTAAEGGVFYEASADAAHVCEERLRAGLADARDLRAWDWHDDAATLVRDHRVEERGVAGSVVVVALFGPLDADWRPD